MENDNDSYTSEAKHILEENRYMVLSTSGQDNTPWASTVFFAHDKSYNFYFLSAVDSRHAKNMLSNKKISFVVFDSTQKLEHSEGIQAEGRVSIVDKKELEKVIAIYCDKLFPNSDIPAKKRYPQENYGDAAEFRFFKITLSKAYVTGTVDRRTEVHFK